MCEDERLDKVADFLAWCTQQGITYAKCGISNFDNTGRGVGAIEDIDKNEVVLSVPDDAVLMPETCSLAEELREAQLFNGSSRGPHAELSGLTIAVMYEACIGQASRWAAYIDFLPKACPGLPLFWAGADLLRLRGSSALDKMTGRGCSKTTSMEQPSQVAQRYAAVVGPFLKSCRRTATLLPPSDAATQATYLWAIAIIASYSFTIGDDKYQALVPIWDAVNHVTGRCNTRLHHCAKTGALQMIATAPVPRGHQVINDFGPLSNAELLRRYGFVETAENLHDCVELSVEDILQACRSLPGQRMGENAGASAFALPDPFADMASCQMRQVRSSPVISTVATWQQHLIPRSGWFRVDSAGVPESRLLETLRLHLLPEQDLLRFLRRLSTCFRSREPLACEAYDIPKGFVESLRRICSARRGQYGLSGASAESIHQSAAAAKKIASSSVHLSNQQAADLIVSRELQCLEQLEEYLSRTSAQAIVERAMLVWLKKGLVRRQ